jgi:hypothetical protein
MKNMIFTIGSILIVSAVVLGGCKEKDPAAEPHSPEPEKASGESGQQPQSNPEAEKAALQAANAWLQLLDSGQYAKSWEEAAEYFRNAVPQNNWQRSTGVFRKPLGKLVTRKLKLTRYTTSAPGAPDGEYVIIQYNTSFENKKSAVETVTPMLDKDGKWRVSGYFIK